jgi:hypothetical protein
MDAVCSSSESGGREGEKRHAPECEGVEHILPIRSTHHKRAPVCGLPGEVDELCGIPRIEMDVLNASNLQPANPLSNSETVSSTRGRSEKNTATYVIGLVHKDADVGWLTLDTCDVVTRSTHGANAIEGVEKLNISQRSIVGTHVNCLAASTKSDCVCGGQAARR